MDAAQRTEFLERLDRDFDSRQRGKILQRFLQLAFDRAGYRLVDERISEGIDFDVIHRTDPSRRFSFEARTTEGFLVPVKLEDLRQMEAREAEGYQTGIAALRIAPGGRWVLLARPWLRTPSVRVSAGNTTGWDALAEEINARFVDVIVECGALALAEGLPGLEALVNQAKAE